VERPAVGLDTLHDNWLGESTLQGFPVQLPGSSRSHNESFDQCPCVELRSCNVGSMGIFHKVFVEDREDGVWMGAANVRAQG